MTGRSALLVSSLAAAFALTLVVEAAARHAQAPSPDDARPFAGTWSAAGQRRTLQTDGDRAAIVHLSGAIVLSSESLLGAGLLAEAIAFDDGQDVSTGRAVWIDARGDRLFSVLAGEPLRNGRRIRGAFTGGTGRYVGATGEYALTWQYVVDGENGAVQGRAADLRGRVALSRQPR